MQVEVKVLDNGETMMCDPHVAAHLVAAKVAVFVVPEVEKTPKVSKKTTKKKTTKKKTTKKKTTKKKSTKKRGLTAAKE